MRTLYQETRESQYPAATAEQRAESKEQSAKMLLQSLGVFRQFGYDF
jgi:hypothetical protein